MFLLIQEPFFQVACLFSRAGHHGSPIRFHQVSPNNYNLLPIKWKVYNIHITNWSINQLRLWHQNAPAVLCVVDGEMWLKIKTQTYTCICRYTDHVCIRRTAGIFVASFTKHYTYCWWKKSCTGWYGKYPIIYRLLYIPGGDRRISSINSMAPFYGLKVKNFNQLCLFRLWISNCCCRRPKVPRREGDMSKFATEIHGGRSFQIIGSLDLLQTVGKKHKISSNWWFNGDLWW